MTARRVQQNDKSTIFKNIPLEDAARNFACYNGKFIVPKGKLTLAIESGGWTIQSASFIVVDDQKANILGRNLLPKIGIKLIQEKPQNYQILTIDEGEKSNPEKKQWVRDNFTQLSIRNGKAKNHVMKTQFIPNATPIQQKGRRIPIHLQERVETELNKLLDHKHIVKLDQCSDKQFISLIVITVKKDQTVKLALVLKKINKFIH